MGKFTPAQIEALRERFKNVTYKSRYTHRNDIARGYYSASREIIKVIREVMRHEKVGAKQIANELGVPYGTVTRRIGDVAVTPITTVYFLLDGINRLTGNQYELALINKFTSLPDEAFRITRQVFDNIKGEDIDYDEYMRIQEKEDAINNIDDLMDF